MMREVFISAVSAELGDVREDLTQLMREAGFKPIVQEDGFYNSAESATVLDQLKSIVDRCDIIVYIVGLTTGFKPNAIKDEFAVFQPAIEDIEESVFSYTQWEYLFHLDPTTWVQQKSKKAIVLLLQPDQVASEKEQNAFRRWIQDCGHLFLSIKEVSRAWYKLRRTEYFKPCLTLNPAEPTPSNLRFFDDHFVGRTLLFQELKVDWETFCSTDFPRGGFRRCLTGLPGIGKTRAAIEFGHQYSSLFGSRFIISGNSPEELRRSFANLSQHCDANVSEDTNQQIEVVKRHLATYSRFLLIVDNIDDQHMWDCCCELTRDLRKGFVLTTGRFADLPETDRIAIGQILIDEAISFLRQRLPFELRQETGDESLTKLAVEVTPYPLALEQAVGFLTSNDISVDEYVCELKQHDMTRLGDEAEFDAVRRTFQTSFTRLTPSAQALLRLLSVFSAEDLPYELFGPPHREAIREASRILFGNCPPTSGRDVVDLQRFSLIERSDIGYRLHRLTAKIATKCFSVDETKQLARIAAKLIVDTSRQLELWSPWKGFSALKMEQLRLLHPHSCRLRDLLDSEVPELHELIACHDQIAQAEDIDVVKNLFQRTNEFVDSLFKKRKETNPEGGDEDIEARLRDAWTEFDRTAAERYDYYANKVSVARSINALSREDIDDGSDEPLTELLRLRIKGKLFVSWSFLRESRAVDAIGVIERAFELRSVFGLLSTIDRLQEVQPTDMKLSEVRRWSEEKLVLREQFEDELYRVPESIDLLTATMKAESSAEKFERAAFIRDLINAIAGEDNERFQVTNKTKVFLSYSHRCSYIARQLYCDLSRAGCVPWIDEADIALNSLWPKSIDDSIRSCDRFLLLWSPEVTDSYETQREYDLAKQVLGHENITVLRVGGEPSMMPESMQALQHLHFATDYWQSLQKLLRHLGKEPVVAPANVFATSDNFKMIRKQLGNDLGRTWTFIVSHPEQRTQKHRLVAVPWMPSGYAMSWRVGAEEAKGRPDEDLFVVLKFTADAHRDPVNETIEFLRQQADERLPDFAVSPPQLLVIEGPQENGKYEIPDDKLYQWKDCIELCSKAIESVGHSGRLHFFMDAPQALSFPLAARLRTTSPFVVYNLDRHTAKPGRYRRVYSSSNQ